MADKSSYELQGKRRKQLRLRHYDYASPGWYFVTICTYRKGCLFGEIANEQMILNEAGKLAHSCWLAIPQHFPHALLDEFIVMPNHIHGIIRLQQQYTFSGGLDKDLGQPGPYRQNKFQQMIPGSISAIVKGFKIGVTKWFR